MSVGVFLDVFPTRVGPGALLAKLLHVGLMEECLVVPLGLH